MTAFLSRNQPAPTERRVYKYAEAAIITGLSESTLKRVIRAGDLRLTKLSTRRVGIRADDLISWLDARAA